MSVQLHQIGAFLSQNEKRGVDHILRSLETETGMENWVALIKPMFTITPEFRMEEVGMVLISSSCVVVMDFKDWDKDWMKSHEQSAMYASQRLQNCAKSITTLLRKLNPEFPPTKAVLLLTREPIKTTTPPDLYIDGIPCLPLKSWRDVFGSSSQSSTLNTAHISQILETLVPIGDVKLSWGIAGYVILESLSTKDDLHHIYRAIHATRRDNVILHLFDITSLRTRNSLEYARQTYELFSKLQAMPWAYRVIEPLIDVPNYERELLYFTLKDTFAPKLELRCHDGNWNTNRRMLFAYNLISSIKEILDFGLVPEWSTILQNICVKSNDTPCYPSLCLIDSTLMNRTDLDVTHSNTIADKTILNGIPISHFPINILYDCLNMIFHDTQVKTNTQIRESIEKIRSTQNILSDIIASLKDLFAQYPPNPNPNPNDNENEDDIQYLSEEAIIQVPGMDRRDYKVIFRVNTDESIYVLQTVAMDRYKKTECGNYILTLTSDKKLRTELQQSHQIAKKYQKDTTGSVPIEIVTDKMTETNIISMRKWVEGAPISLFSGMLPLLAKSCGEPSTEEMAFNWLEVICTALNGFHKNGVVHGNITPQHIILSGNEPIIINLNNLKYQNDPPTVTSHNPFYPPTFEIGRQISPADDIHALANCFLFLIFGTDPLSYGKSNHINYHNLINTLRTKYPSLAIFIEKAMNLDSPSRYQDAQDVLNHLIQLRSTDEHRIELDDSETPAPTQMTYLNREIISHDGSATATIEWLNSLLKSYPGSKRGNSETRGLDSEFAINTYVPTQLEEALYQDILNRKIRLLVLCGNAGDGKTALLQHLASRLGLSKLSSSQRVLEGMIQNGALLRMNLDGSAAWREHSADEIMDEFLRPFFDGPPNEDIIHLLAINDGRLLEWIDQVENKTDSSPSLTEELSKHLQGETTPDESHIRFINLNQRSLVGGIDMRNKRISTEFLDRLIDSLYGGNLVPEIWKTCDTCPAKSNCDVFCAAKIFGTDQFPKAVSKSKRLRARDRLYEALQAVHLRGVTHITMRELRATLVYILFGVQTCEERIHGSNTQDNYWDRAFNAESPQRQGETLRDLALFDPALDSHPKIDRYLTCKYFDDQELTPPHYVDHPLPSARRRAYFEWTEEDAVKIAAKPDAIGLYGAGNLALFRDLTLLTEEEKRNLAMRLCRGISRLEDLPPLAYNDNCFVPLRIPQRTPTETYFWIKKPIDSFRLEAELPPYSPGLERLHCKAFLIYQYRSGCDERLGIGADLFNLLLDICEGYQIGDISHEDTFAQLSIFMQRLVREDEQEIFAWNPMQEDAIYKVYASMNETMQVLSLVKPPIGG